MSLPPSQRSAPPPPKQIRFVSTDGQPQTKRRRINAACRTCRRRKIRCSGEQPVCQTCLDHKHTCLGYNESTNPPPNPAPQSPKQNDGKGQAPETTNGGSPEGLPSTLPLRGPEPILKPPDIQKSQEMRESPLHPGSEPQQPPVDSPESNRSSSLSSRRTHVPYFRYFGPTAIVPGFKQTVVRVRETRKSNPSLSTDSVASIRSPTITKAGAVSSTLEPGCTSNSIHFYDPEDSLPNSEVVSHLCDVFFTHLGCNFPFLQRDRFLRDLKEKRLEPILVDAVCALAARFSLHPLLTTASSNETNYPRHGDIFAHRAMCAVVDALSCPTIPSVQACLLLAYEEFGSNHDSGLWMYLGISIRMAQDLGLQKLEGMKHRYGRVGLTPKGIKSGQANKPHEGKVEEGDDATNLDAESKATLEDEMANERERVDLFWSIFFLDRVISSGTGRPVTLRDDDIEICFPLQRESSLSNGWPAPFTPLVRVTHLYGRVTDVLNAIKEVNHVTPETLKQLASMEGDLTGIYQKLSPRLHFNAVNFQNYVKSGEGTNFILLHLWFHALIVLLHQPTLLHSFSGPIQQLLPNSRELSMSSAKTVADILAFAELIDAKSFIGNPFTSQPIYTAACAFLMESTFYSLPSSRSETPPTATAVTNGPAKVSVASGDTTSNADQNMNAKHSLLAAAAKDNYQRCYRALKSLETHWAGTKYILTVLDQKSKGIWDPQLYTAEEMDSAIELPSMPGLTPPVWKVMPTQQDLKQATSKSGEHTIKSTHESLDNNTTDAGPQAIGWALTGATDSSQPNLSFLYQTPATQPNQDAVLRAQARYPNTYQPMPQLDNATPPPINSYSGPNPQYQAGNPIQGPGRVSDEGMPSSSDYLRLVTENVSPPNIPYGMNPHSPYGNAGPPTGTSNSFPPGVAMNSHPGTPYGYGSAASANHAAASAHRRVTSNPMGDYGHLNSYGPGMTIQSQDIDMTTLQDQSTFPFSFDGEFVPWLEYLPEDTLRFFGDYRPLMPPDDGGGGGSPTV